MKSPRNAVVLVFLTLVGATAYLLLRYPFAPEAGARSGHGVPIFHDSTGHRAEPEVPLASTATVRIPTPDNSQKFKHYLHCYTLERRLASLRRLPDCDAQLAAKPGLETQYEGCVTGWAHTQDEIYEATNDLARSRCGNDADIVRNYFAAARAAAKQGDPDAQLCYVQSSFVGADGVPHFTNDEITEYRHDAPLYASAAMERGDWRIVYLLSLQYSRAFGLLFTIHGLGSPATVYKMERLLSLGAVGDYAEQLDVISQDLASALPAHTVQEANTWAAQTYSQYFAESPRLTSPPVPCG